MLNYHILSHSPDIHQIVIQGVLDASQNSSYHESFNNIRKEISDNYFKNKFLKQYLIFDLTQLTINILLEHTVLITLSRQFYKLIHTKNYSVVICNKYNKKMLNKFKRFLISPAKFIKFKNLKEALRQVNRLKQKNGIQLTSDKILIPAKIPMLLLVSVLVKTRYFLLQNDKKSIEWIYGCKYLLDLIEEEKFAELQKLILNDDKKLSCVIQLFQDDSDQAFKNTQDILLQKKVKLMECIGSSNIEYLFYRLDFVVLSELRYYIPLIHKMLEMAEIATKSFDYNYAAEYIDTIHFLPEALVGNNLNKKLYKRFWQLHLKRFKKFLPKNKYNEITIFLK